MIKRAHHGWRIASLVVALALATGHRAQAQPPLTGVIETVSSSGTTYDYPAVSADGRYVAFVSELQLDPTQVVPSSFHIWVRDRQHGATVLVSRSDLGVAGNNRSQRPAISADGRFVAFSSAATNLIDGDTNDVDDIFVHDRDADGNRIFDEPGGTRLVRASVSSRGVQANCVSARPSISSTGRYVAFDSCATNWTEVAGKTLAVQDIFVRDMESGATIWVSPPTRNSTNGFNNHHSGDASISGDGRYVAFGSQATTQPQDLEDFGSSQIYVRDTCLGADAGCAVATEWASPQAHVDFQPSDAFKPAISADGRFVAYESRSTSLAPGDTNEATDIFVFDRQTRGIARVNVSSAGEQALTTGPSTCSGSLHASISGDGRLVTFESCANNLVADDQRPPNYQDVFVHDRDADGNGVHDEAGGIATILISRNPLGAPADGSSLQPTISRTGKVVVFSSFSRDITPTAAPIGLFAWASTNAEPVADAGPDQDVARLDPIGTVVTLDGSASHDPDGDALTFTWTGPFDTLTGAVIAPRLPEGTHTITLTVTDGHGGTATDTVTVIVGVREPVVIDIVETIAVTDTPGMVPAALLTVTEAIAVQDTPNLLPSAWLGIDESITVTEAAAALPATLLEIAESVTVTDAPTGLVAPVNRPPALSLPASLVVEAVSAAGASVIYTATARDPEDGSIVPSCAPPSGAVFPLGATTVTCSVTDSAGAQVTGSFTVTVRDRTRPRLVLPGAISAIATSGSGAVVDYDATAVDLVDGSLTPSCSPRSHATFRLGVTTVTCVATDAHGNTATGNFTVTVTLGLPLITGEVSATGRDLAGRIYVDLTLANRGTGHARDIRLTTLRFLTLSGSGAVTYDAALSGALPRAAGPLDAGRSTAPLRIFLRAPVTVKRFSIIAAGTLENVIGIRLPFIAAEILVIPPQ